MKFSKLVFNLALLFVIATGFTLSSCSDRRLDEVRDPSPIAQLAMSVPDSDLSPEVLYCGCIAPPPPFGTSKTITYLSGIKNVKNPGFSVSVNKTSDCEMEGYDLPTTECVCLKKWYYLEFNQNYSFSDFQSYQVSKLDGTPTEWRVFPNEDGIYTNTPFIAKFQWSNANIGNPIPTAAQITDGGICIIGIVTDPRPPIQAPEPEGENE
jgi:hypothetical protein